MLLMPIGMLASPAAAIAAAPLLLDGIAATVKGAFSLRRLRASYGGPALQVRRSSDSAMQDIGFEPGGLDTAALLAFCGAGDGFVSRWYDQSGLGQDVAQPAAGQQPRIVASGAVKTMGNATARPGMLLASSAQQGLFNAAFAITAASSYAAAIVAERTAASGGYDRVLSYTGNGNNDYDNPSSVIFALYQGGLEGYQNGDRSNAAIGTGPFQAASVWTGAAHTMTVDGVSGAAVAASGTLNSPGWLGIGCRYGGPSDSWDGFHAEHIIISGALTAADQAAIRTSQQAYYGTP